MAYSQGSWVKSTVEGRLVLKCTVTTTTSETDIVTAPTPANSLDPTKPWILVVNAAGTDISDSSAPVDIYMGFSSTFATTSLSSTVTVTDGYEVASDVMDNVSDEALVVTVNPNRTAAKVQSVTGTAGEVNAGTAPFYAINIDNGGSAKAADTIFYIVQ